MSYRPINIKVPIQAVNKLLLAKELLELEKQLKYQEFVLLATLAREMETESYAIKQQKKEQQKAVEELKLRIKQINVILL